MDLVTFQADVANLGLALMEDDRVNPETVGDILVKLAVACNRDGVSMRDAALLRLDWWRKV